MQRFTQHIVDFLITWRLAGAGIAVLLAAAAIFTAGPVEFDRSIENMFAPSDPLMGPYRKLKRTFGGNEIAMAVYRDDELLADDGSGIERLIVLSRELAGVDGVKAAISLDQPLGPMKIVRPDDPVADRTRRLFQGYTHSVDGKLAAIVCMLEPESDPGSNDRQKTIHRIRSIVQERPSGMVAGEPVMVTDGFRYVEQDGRKLGGTTTLLLGLVILVCFRSLRWVLVPLVVVQFALLVTRAVLFWSGMRLSMVSSMLTAIVTVVGVAAVIHVIVRFRQSRLDGLLPDESLSQVGRLLLGPVFWACATTTAGFASLMLAEVGPVRDFGIMMAIGTLMVLLSMGLVLPTLVLAGRFDTDPRRAWGERFLDSGLDRVIRGVGRRPKTLGLIALGLTAAVGFGVLRLEVETDFTRNFRADSRIVRSYEIVETRLGGAGVWDVVLPAPERLDWDYLSKVRKLEDRLREEIVIEGPDGTKRAGLAKILSIDDALTATSPIDIGKVPTGLFRNATLHAGLRKMRSRIPALMDALHAEDPDHPGHYYYRIMLRAGERQPSAQKQGLIRSVRRIALEEFPPTSTSPGAETTGFFVLLTNLIDSILHDQWLTFGVATLGIGLVMLLALRSLSLAAVTLVPNVLPIVVVTGLLGWADLRINMGAAMIAAVSMGLSIDSSIHYVTAFRRERREGRRVDESLAAVHQTVGRAMVFSTLALIVGFAVLGTSQFVPTIYFGVLVSLAMLGGLAGNLILLPVLLKLVEREGAKGCKPALSHRSS